MYRNTKKKSALLKRTFFCACTVMFVTHVLSFNGYGQDLAQNYFNADHYVPITWFAEDSEESVFKQKISVVIHGVSFDKAIETIADLGKIRFSYDKRYLPSEDVTLILRDATFIEAFQTLFDGTGLEVLASSRGQIVIRRDREIQPATGTLEGQITETGSGVPLVGATIYIEELELGASTDVNGEYLIESVPSGEYTVRASYIGYRQHTITLTIGPGENLSDFSLRPDLFGLDEIVVTGVVGDTESKRLPFSVGRVTSRDLEMAPSTNAVSAIRGRIPGVTMVQSTGLPGSDVSVILRGATSILGQNAPLYIVDGVILGATMTDIEALDIDNVEVIKGAAASSLYGSRAANGVINITTRRGSNLPDGTPRVAIRNEAGYNQLPAVPGTNQSHAYEMSGNPELPWVDSEGNPTNQRVGRRSTGPASTAFMDQPYPVSTYDHVERFFHSSSYYSNYISVGHRMGRVNYVASFNNSQNSGIMRNSDGYGRRNVRLNLDARLADNLRISASGYYASSKRDEVPTSGENSPFYGLLIHAPDVNLAARNDDGIYFHHPDALITYNNPLYDVAYIESSTHRNRAMGSSDLRYQPLEWLELSGNVSYDRNATNTERYVPIWYQQARNIDNRGRLQLGSNFTEAINASLTASMNHDFGNLATRTQLRVLQEASNFEAMNIDAQAFSVENVRTVNATDPDRQSMSSSGSQIRSQGYYLITNLDYQGKYILDFVGRRDGSSLFGADERWHNYYRASAAYRISEEDWFDISPVDELKFRASIGTAGGRPNFAAQYETWSVSGSTVTKANLGNRNLKPEFATEKEFGIELGLYERVLLDVTHANTVVEDQLIQLPLLSYYGFNNQWVNGGTIESNTLEISLTAYAIQRSDMSLSFTALYDRTRSRITAFDRPPQLISSMFYLRPGEEVGTLYLPKWIESYSELETTLGGDYSEYFDQNDDGYLVPVGSGNTWKSSMWGTTVVADDGTVLGSWGLAQRFVDKDGNDRVNHGSSLPDFNLSAGTTFRYKSFTTSLLFEGQFGGQVYNDTRQRRVRENLDVMNDQAGKPDNEKKPIAYYQNDISALHGQWVEDSTYLKLREVALRYRFDHSSLRPLFGNAIDSISLSLIGRNLYTWTNYSGFDPEIGDIVTRRDNFLYPNFRQITGSLEIQF